MGRIYFAPADVLLTDTDMVTDVVQPDLMFISSEREHIRTPANIQGAPDLVVEILSPSSARRDWRDKRDLYARHGVKEYWIVDPANRLVYVMRLRDGALEIEGTYAEGDTVSSATLKGFSINLDEIF